MQVTTWNDKVGGHLRALFQTPMTLHGHSAVYTKMSGNMSDDFQNFM